METSFVELKRKEVVNLLDGKRLGKVTDLSFSYPDGRILGIVVPGGKGWRMGKGEQRIAWGQIKKIGVDVVLCELRSPQKTEKKEEKWEQGEPQRNVQRQLPDRRDYGDYE